jgi:5-hydroxyisourate hydrolase
MQGSYSTLSKPDTIDGASQRLASISAHLERSSTMATKDPITCHVLDTVAGRPAANISATLTLISPGPPSPSFTATTDSDGRIMRWSASPGPSLEFVIAISEPSTPMIWSLKFDTGRYFGASNTFFPEVEIKFFFKASGEHYHIPLLLGPWSYTTYRGS